MRNNRGSDGNVSDSSVHSLELSDDSDDSVCRCDSQSISSDSDYKIERTCSHEDNGYGTFGRTSSTRLGKSPRTGNSLEKVNTTAHKETKRISSGGDDFKKRRNDSKKNRKDECARDRKINNGWSGKDTTGQVKNVIQEYHCKKKDGASTYTCVIVKKIDLPKTNSIGSESSEISSRLSKDRSYNMKGNAAPPPPKNSSPSSKKPSKDANQYEQRGKNDLCAKCSSMQTACSQHTTNTQQSRGIPDSSVCSRGSVCSKNSAYSEKSSEKDQRTIAGKRSYLSWMNSAQKSTSDSASKSKSNPPPTNQQNGKVEFTKKSSVSLCHSDSVKSICVTESKIIIDNGKDVPVEEKSSQTDFGRARSFNSAPNQFSQSDTCSPPSSAADKSPESKAHVSPSTSKTTTQTGFMSYFSRASSNINTPAESSNDPPVVSKTCLKKTPSKDKCGLNCEKTKSGSNNLGVKCSKIGFRTDSRQKSMKKNVADKASQTDVTKRKKSCGPKESKKAPSKRKTSKTSLCSEGSGHTTTLVFKPASKRSLRSVKSVNSKNSFPSQKKSQSRKKRGQSQDKSSRSKKAVCPKSSVSSKPSDKSLHADSREGMDGEMNEPGCSMSCKDSFMPTKNDPCAEIARTSYSMKSCDIKTKMDDNVSSQSYEECLCEDPTCDITIRPSSCGRRKGGFFCKLFRRKTAEERCLQKREKREKQKQKRIERERKWREKERERDRKEQEKERKDREKEREKERKDKEKECKKRRKLREKERKKREKEREKQRKEAEKEREKERKRREKEKREEEKRKLAVAETASDECSLTS